jgi:hypothetical protein
LFTEKKEMPHCLDQNFMDILGMNKEACTMHNLGVEGLHHYSNVVGYDGMFLCGKHDTIIILLKH